MTGESLARGRAWAKAQMSSRAPRLCTELGVSPTPQAEVLDPERGAGCLGQHLRTRGRLPLAVRVGTRAASLDDRMAPLTGSAQLKQTSLGEGRAQRFHTGRP